MKEDITIERVKTGIIGLDEILQDGLVSRRSYLIRGGPGTGKTTLGVHFLLEGCNQKNENVLFITLGEGEENIKANAISANMDPSKIFFLDLSPNSDFFSEKRSYDLFSPADVERDPLTEKIIKKVKDIKPSRVFLDSTSHLRYLSIDIHQFRKQLLSFIRFLLEQNSTLLFTSESTPILPDDDVMYLSDGVINLTLTEYGRRIEVTKFRGSNFLAGQHTLKLTDHGVEIFPKLKPVPAQNNFEIATFSSGIDEIDLLLHGGVEQGTSSIISGAPGVGKTTLGLLFLKKAAEQNQRSVLFSFEESTPALLYRAEVLKIPITQMIKTGKLAIISIEPLLFSGDEILHMLRNQIDEKNAKLIMLDSISGYNYAIRDKDPLVELRNLFKFLTSKGVTTLAINETESIIGDFKATERNISGMADNILFIRYIELQGQMRKAIGVLKKRLSDFERNLREFSITTEGIKVGEPLFKLRGILKGTPELITNSDK